MDTEMVTDMEGAMENRQNNLLGQEEKIDITILIDDMWRCLKKFFWLFLIMIVLGGSFSYFQARRSYVPMYEAYSSFAVKARNSYGYSDTYYNKTIAGQMSKTFPYILTSGVLNQVVAESLGMESVPASISAEAVQNSALFTISVQSQDPQMAHDVLLAVIENYPRVAQYIIGDTELIMVDESGVPDEPVNPPDYTKNVKSGVAAVCDDPVCSNKEYGSPGKRPEQAGKRSDSGSYPHGTAEKAQPERETGSVDGPAGDGGCTE